MVKLLSRGIMSFNSVLMLTFDQWNDRSLFMLCLNEIDNNCNLLPMYLQLIAIIIYEQLKEI